MSLKNVKFDEDLRQEWIDVHSKARLTRGEIRLGDRMCALGTLGQVLVNRGKLEWLRIPGTNCYNFLDKDSGMEGTYSVLKQVPAFDSTFIGRVYDINDSSFYEFGEEVSRSEVIEYIRSLEVEA